MQVDIGYVCRNCHSKTEVKITVKDIQLLDEVNASKIFDKVPKNIAHRCDAKVFGLAEINSLQASLVIVPNNGIARP